MPSLLVYFNIYILQISLSEDDVDKRRQRYRQSGAEKSFDEIDFGKKQNSARVSFGTQTDFREIEVQTEPCTISYDNDDVIRRKPEVTSLSILKHGRGLPVKTFDDLVRFVDQTKIFSYTLPMQ